MKRFFLKTLVAAVAVASVGMAAAQDIKSRTFKLATQNPKGHPTVTGTEKFAELVAAKSGGKLKINLFPGGVLGGDQANVSALQGGTLEMVVMNSGILASQVKEFAVFDFPFQFASGAEANAVLDGPFGQKMHDKLADKGMIGLAYWELGFRDLTNGKRAINTVDDIAGLKIRVIPNPINLDWVKALGANPVPMAFPELYAALETRALDGQENPMSVILANKFNEVQKHLALTHHQYNPQSLLMSKKVWDTLSADERKIIADAAREASVVQRQLAAQASDSALDALKKSGMAVTQLSDAEMNKLREKLRPVIEKHSASVGAETVQALQAEIEKVRKK